MGTFLKPWAKVTEKCENEAGVQPMPSYICCAEDHSTTGISIHEAAVALSEGHASGVCKRCGKELEYRIDHV
jgi:transcription initiation factor IIE alpha subunit